MSLKLRLIRQHSIQTRTIRAILGLGTAAFFLGVVPNFIFKKNNPQAAISSTVRINSVIKKPEPEPPLSISNTKPYNVCDHQIPTEDECYSNPPYQGQKHFDELLKRAVTKPPEVIADQSQIFKGGYSPKIGAVFLSLNSDEIGLTGVRVIDVTPSSIKVEYFVSAYTPGDSIFGTLSYKKANQLFESKSLDQDTISPEKPLNINAFSSTVQFFVKDVRSSNALLVIKINDNRQMLFIERTVEEQKDY
ncbi:MAG: hypothetical protein AABX38_03050 [Candidatus Micrarchaeota archaeon]